MMGFIYGLLGVIFGFFLILIIIYLIVRYFLNRFGFKSYSLSELFSVIKSAREREATRHKQVSGMTNILLPSILKDFTDFNEKEFYNKTEEVIRNYLRSIEEKDTKYLEDSFYELIYDKVCLQVADLKDNGNSYYYDDIVFHKHAIKSYQRRKGMVKLEISTALEYYYRKECKDKKITTKNEKKQTRYTTTYIYIYDTKQAGFDIRILGLNCPNCGSPLSSFEDSECPYCKSGLNITVAKLLKCWKIIDIKEDY